MTVEEFISKSTKVHNGKYDYSLVTNINSKDKVCIKYPEHGTFYQLARKHSYGDGCVKCAGLFSSIDTFIEKANKIHNSKYDYSLVNYVNIMTKIAIICPLHGEFRQIPNDHVIGSGCQECSGRKKLDTKTFIKKANKLHDNKYDYSLVIYKNHRSKVVIICDSHGQFEQLANSHLNLQGCPRCRIFKSELIIEKYLKENNINYIRQYSFDDLKDKGLLKFDFAVFKDGVLFCLIEYNGEQHYKFKEKFHQSVEDFESSKHRDQLKIDYCDEHNIKLIIIKYNENILNKLVL